MLPPSLDPEPKPKKKVKRIKNRSILKATCVVLGHKIVDMPYIDSHGNDDSIYGCKRCGELF